MKKFFNILAVALFSLPLVAHGQIPSYSSSARAGVALFTGQAATATSVSGQVRLPTGGLSGVLTVTEAGITGSPSGCTITLAYQGSNTQTVGAVASTTAFTPSTGTQTFNIAPTQLAGDAVVATYACSSTYPTAGTLTASFSSIDTTSLDPCFVTAKQSVAISIAGATATQLVALAAGKSVYVCGFTASVGATTTIQLQYGTGSVCASGTTQLTGVIAPSTGTVVSFAADGTEFTAPAGNALCLTPTGTGGVQGFLSYVQQ